MNISRRHFLMGSLGGVASAGLTARPRRAAELDV